MKHVEANNFSIIVPTFREAKNIPELIQRIADIDACGQLFELLLVDDHSQDGTEEIVKEWRERYPWVRLVVRHGKRSLSEAVIEGLHQARYPLLIIMDADLSHPPEKIPVLLNALIQPRVDMVIGSRYVEGGSTDTTWPWSRKIVSHVAAWLAKIVIAVNVKDPLSGFIAVRKATCFSGAPLQPVGWKISLEIMVKAHCRNIHEVPIHFTERRRGKSKLTLKVVWNYLQHLRMLFFYRLKTREH